LKNILITTSLKETFPDEPTNLILLGDWCRLYKEKKFFENNIYSIIEYHYDDTQKILDDFEDFKIIYEKVLNELSEVLNNLHGLSYSKRYWQISIGFWLGLFIQIIYDRYFMIKKVFDNKNIDEVFLIKTKEEDIVPNNSLDFFQFAGSSDDWNEKIFSEIISFLKPKIKISFIEKEIINIKSEKNNLYYFFKKKLNRLIRNSLSLATKYMGNKSIVLYAINVNFISKIKLLFFSKSIFRAYDLKNDFHFKYDQLKRNFIKDNLKFIDKENNQFLELLNILIPKYIPKIFVEGYQNAHFLINKSGLPSNSKVIFTDNACIFNDLFKLWAAKQVENSSKLIIGQHGGHYGTCKFFFSQDYEIEISDKFLTWGWSMDNNKSKLIPFGAYCLLNKKHFLNKKNKKNILLVETSFPRYFYQFHSFPLSASQYKYYSEFIFKFISHIPPELRKNFLVRLDIDKGLKIYKKNIWNDKFPDIKISRIHKNIINDYNESKIVISTYNATTYLETLSLNIPTLIFWDEKYFQLNDDVKIYFDLLKDVHIFFTDPKAASLHLLEIWDNIEKWWLTEDVQEVRKIFCSQFANTNGLNIRKFYELISKNKT